MCEQDLLNKTFYDITEFTDILELMCEWSCTGKKPERCCLCEQHCVFMGNSGNFMVIYLD